MTALQSDIDITGWWLEFSIVVRMLQFQPRHALKTQKVALHALNSRGFDKVGIGGQQGALCFVYGSAGWEGGDTPWILHFLLLVFGVFLTTDY